MGRLVANLLDMIRVETGALAGAEGVAAAAGRRRRGAAPHRRSSCATTPSRTDFPADLPLVPMDEILLEQVFVNLLENAARHTPPGTPIEVGAEARPRRGDRLRRRSRARAAAGRGGAHLPEVPPRRAAAAAPASAWGSRSAAASSPRTAGASGPRTAPGAAPSSASLPDHRHAAAIAVTEEVASGRPRPPHPPDRGRAADAAVPAHRPHRQRLPARRGGDGQGRPRARGRPQPRRHPARPRPARPRRARRDPRAPRVERDADHRPLGARAASRTRWRRSTSARTTTSPSRSAWTSCSPGSGSRSGTRPAPPGAPPEPVFEAGDLRVDLPRGACGAGRQARCTSRPPSTSCCAILVRHAGKVLTHRQLLKEVWGANYANQSHYVRVYMAQLRQKLEADPARPRLLLTEPGVGYRLKAE